MEFDPFAHHTNYRDMYAYEPCTRELYTYLERLLDVQRQTFALNTQLDITPILRFLAGLRRADIAGNVKLFYRDLLREVIVASNLVCCGGSPSKEILRERVMAAKREGRLGLLDEATWEIEESCFDAQYVAQSAIRRIVSADDVYESLRRHAVVLEMAFALRAEIVGWITGKLVVLPAPIVVYTDKECEEGSYYEESSAPSSIAADSDIPAVQSPTDYTLRVQTRAFTSTPTRKPVSTNPSPINISPQTKLLMRRLYTNSAQQQHNLQQRNNVVSIGVSRTLFHYFAFTFLVSYVILSL